MIDSKNNKICELRSIAKKLEHYLEVLEEEEDLCYEDFALRKMNLSDKRKKSE
jgi:hypothetical protein